MFWFEGAGSRIYPVCVTNRSWNLEPWGFRTGNRVSPSTAPKPKLIRDRRLCREEERSPRGKSAGSQIQNKLVAQFISNLMKRGKKSTAESILYGAFDILEKKLKESPLEVFERRLLCKARNRGQIPPCRWFDYQVPTEVISHERVALGIRWLILNARERGRKNHAGKTGGASLSMPRTTAVPLSRKKRLSTKWRGEQGLCTLRFYFGASRGRTSRC